MKLYNPKTKNSFVMQFGFPCPEKVLKKKDAVKIYNIDEILRAKQHISG